MTQEELDALMAGDLEGVAAETDDAQASEDENLNLETAEEASVESKDLLICHGLRLHRRTIIRWFIS